MTKKIGGIDRGFILDTSFSITVKPLNEEVMKIEEISQRNKNYRNDKKMKKKSPEILWWKPRNKELKMK